MKPVAKEDELLRMLLGVAPFALRDMRIFRRPIINGRMAAGWWARAGEPGQADAYALCRGGRHIELECKAAHGKWYAEQLAWRAFCQSFDVPYLVLRAEARELPALTVERWVHEIRKVAEG